MNEKNKATVIDLYYAMNLSPEEAIGAAVESIPDAALQSQIEGVLGPLFNMINQGESYEKILAQLSADNPLLNIDELVEIMARAFFVSEVWGKINRLNNALEDLQNVRKN